VSIFLRIFFPFLLVLIFSISVFSTASAQQESGVKIIPASIEDGAEPGQVITKELSVTNVSDTDKVYYVYKRDIIGVEEGGVPVFADDGAEKTGFEITEWISFSSETIEIKAGETVSFPITISVPNTASPGSHFGGVFVSQEAPKLRQIGAGVGYEVGSILSLRVAGDVVDDARIRSFSTDKLFYGNKNVAFTAKIENQGNILIRPRGPLEIKSMFGGDPVLLSVNESLAGVFPGTVRELNFSWNEEGLGFGRYEAILALVYDADQGQKTIDASLVFWIFPIKVMLPIVGGFVALLLIGYFLTRYYVNQAVLRAQGSRKIVSSRYRRQVGISRLTFVFVAIMGAFVLFLLALLIMFA
jgi:hypothetical protein